MCLGDLLNKLITVIIIFIIIMMMMMIIIIIIIHKWHTEACGMDCPVC